jgi:hypothetical protein
MLLAVLAAVAGALQSPVALAQEPTLWTASRPEDLRVALVTFGPGDPIASYFGHDAMIVEDPTRGETHLYNFGMFSFGKGMLPQYLMGRLTFWIADTPLEKTIAKYIATNRSVHVQELNLAPAKRMEMALAFEKDVLPENREYRYDHYLDNCSLRLRDAIDRALDGQFHGALRGPGRLTYREHTRRHAQRNLWLEFALMFWMNDSMEQPLRAWDELFLPGELERQVAHMQYIDEHGARVPLVSATRVVFEARRPGVPDRPATRWPWALLLGTCAGAALCATAWFVARGSRLARVLFGAEHALLGLTLGVLGTVGFLMWTLTEHSVTYGNENQWLANPLTLLLWPLGVAIAAGRGPALRKAGQVFYALGALALLLCCGKLLPGFDQDTSLPMAFILPITFGGVCAHWLLGRRRRMISRIPRSVRSGSRSSRIQKPRHTPLAAATLNSCGRT